MRGSYTVSESTAVWIGDSQSQNTCTWGGVCESVDVRVCVRVCVCVCVCVCESV